MQEVLKIFVIVTLKSFSHLKWFLYEEQRIIQNPEMEHFCEKQVNDIWLSIIFVKHFILDVWQGSEGACGEKICAKLPVE